jgi:hypothetical protein
MSEIQYREILPRERKTMAAFAVVREIAPPRVEGFPAIKQDDPGIKKQTAVCPQCGKTTIKQMRAIDTYTCLACKESFSKEDVIDVQG